MSRFNERSGTVTPYIRARSPEQRRPYFVCINNFLSLNFIRQLHNVACLLLLLNVRDLASIKKKKKTVFFFVFDDPRKPTKNGDKPDASAPRPSG